ncbi:potassium-transporting ATPase subunit KdpA [Caulobacter sp. S45]|uniref:potassium-transporting ATPase subunit KdpA n=1 Tax=Caulobacter sp. S45 TaxID=1641861 RepID=UPI00131E9937|nr:potassium-transporting ATPase subunit KdpA [Caulobacter sp. S45]
MNWQGWAEIALTLGLAVLLGWPIGVYMARVWEGRSTWLDPVLRPVERLFYAASGVDPTKGQGWMAYLGALLAFNAAGFFLLYLILRAQGLLPLNPMHFAGMSPHLAFNTAISFVTNTNWQSYSGESTLSNLSQMSGLTVQNFVSAASGIAVAAALARAFAANRGETLGNFWADLTRTTLYILLPISVVFAIVLVASGVPQTLMAHIDAHTLEGAKQGISVGPVASQEIIKQLGTNGGGFFGANSAHPFENPNAWSNLIEEIAMNAVGFGCVIAFGRVAMAGREARALVIAMVVLLVGASAAIYASETRVTPALLHAGVAAAPNMEGKEVRFGAPSTAVWTAMTTGASDGGVNGALESFTPLGGGTAMFMIKLGEILPGGVGSGLYGIVVMAIISVFVAGLMVGRTPEYLGKKIEAREVKYAVLATLILPVTILGFAAVSAVSPIALKSVSATGPHGLTEMLYAYASAVGNNGSAFGGLNANTPWWDTTLGIAMALGRFAYIVPVMAMAGALAAKPKLQPTAGTLPTHGLQFIGLLIGLILILGGLQYFPPLALGPIVEHFQMLSAVSH